jgi:hypothetical protein
VNLEQIRRETVRRIIFAAWAMATLVLFFCVILLVWELVRQGADPMAALRATPAANTPAEPAPVAAPAREPGLPREISLYFAAPDRAALVPARASIPFAENLVDNCRAALAALAAGPGDALLPVLPPDTGLRAAYLLEGGELVLDFSRELLTAHTQVKSAGLEALLIYGVVQTLTQPALAPEGSAPVQRVRFLVEGAAPPEAFPAHFDLSAPVAPDRRWVAADGPGGNA